ncbi:ArsA family ATPase [Streptomyces xiamenensis]|uniref:ArsA family ATPase n=1 Tax=Streptomyces TaxID=1883 RepID=UPI0004CA70C1|nr:ArsA-related P-loop ATPase [Streptomyces sp. NRRL F-2890]
MTSARVLLVTGPGGAGTTTVAAGTALAEARAGRSVLLLGERVGTLSGVAAVRPDTGQWFRDGVLGIQRQTGADLLHEDELTALPGSEGLALLTALAQAHRSGRWQTLVVDLPPVTEAIRLLALPELLARYVRRLLPGGRPASLLAQLAGLPYEAAGRWAGELDQLHALLTSPATAVRLVVEPTAQAPATVRMARAGLALHGLALETVIANRVLPSGSPDPWLREVAAAQQSALDALPAETRDLPHLGGTPGEAELTELAASGALDWAPAGEPRRLTPVLDDGPVWRLPLPGANRSELDLVRRGDELFLTVGPFRRAVPLPAELRHREVTGAALEESGALAVRFAPDPG